MRILVVGGSGFIGTRLVRELLDAGHEVRILDCRPSEAFNGVVTVADVRNTSAMEMALRDVDAVYHLAAEHRDNVRPSSRYYTVNVGGAENLVRAAEITGVRRIIFTSSVAVYGLDQSLPDEQTPPKPFNHYAKSKLEAEEVLRRWASRGSDRSLAIVRPTVVFGEGNTGNVHTLITQVLRNRFVIVGTGENRKSMAYVGNLTKFMISVLTRGSGALVINYADKPDLSVNELVRLIQEQLGRGDRGLLRIPYPLGLLGAHAFDAVGAVTGGQYSISAIRVKKFCANTQISTGALEELGFDPPFAIEEGLRRMIEHLRSSATPVETYPRLEGDKVRRGPEGMLKR